MDGRWSTSGFALLWVVVAGCRGPSTASHPVSNTTTTPRAASAWTDLRVSIVNHRQLQRTCTGAPSRRYVITLDGREVASVDVPCTTAFQAPAPTFAAKPFAVPPGSHRIGVRDLAGGAEAVRELRFPVLEPATDLDGRTAGALLADRLLIDANDDGLEIGEPKAFVMRM